MDALDTYRNKDKASNLGLIDRGAEKILSYLLSSAGLEISTSESADIVVRDPSFYRDVLTKGSIGLGDSYVAGKWDSIKIDEVIFKILSSGIYQKFAPFYEILRTIKSRVMNLQSKERAGEVIEKHYDLPAGLYKQFLDPYFQYTCARFEGTDDLDEAQRIKMDNICQKAGLKQGDRVMDVGGGWGGLAQFMAENYGVSPTVVTLSREQAEHIRQKHSGKVEVLECDYRDIPDNFRESFDAITAAGILEHIGHKNYAKFLKILHRSLKAGGNLLIHALYTPHSSPGNDSWVDKEIFPNGELSPRELIEREISRLFQPVEGSKYPTFEELTPHYPPTLHAWKNRLTEAREKGRVKISEQEFRKWVFYFMLSAGALKVNHVKVGQFLYRKNKDLSIKRN